MALKEFQKLQDIYRSLNSKTDKHAVLQEVAAVAAGLLNSPLSLITIIDANDEHYFYNKLDSLAGRDAVQSFCLNLSPENPLLIVNNTLKDRAAIKNRYVHGRPYIRFFAAIMLRTRDGHELGCLSIADETPKTLSKSQVDLLKIMAKMIVQIIEFDFGAEALNNHWIYARKQAMEDLDNEIAKLSTTQ